MIASKESSRATPRRITGAWDTSIVKISIKAGNSSGSSFTYGQPVRSPATPSAGSTGTAVRAGAFSSRARPPSRKVPDPEKLSPGRRN